jgi:hypothetical protein
MNRRLIARLALLGILSFAGGCERSQTQRTIPYDSKRPIAGRLLPGDKEVLVEMKIPDEKADAGPQESFDQEIQRLRRNPIIALVRVASALGEIADRGTWVRTRVNAGIDRLVKGPPDRTRDQLIEFTYSAGTAQIGEVVVTTGKFPRFVQGEPYLVFLLTRPGNPALIWDGVAFRVDEQGALQRVAIDGGGEQSFKTNLIGRSATEVMAALAP